MALLRHDRAAVAGVAAPVPADDSAGVVLELPVRRRADGHPAPHVDLAEPTSARRRSKPRIPPLDAQRLIELLTLRLGPAAAAGLITFSHTRDAGEGLTVLVAVLFAARLVDRSRFPLELMPATRVLISLFTPLLGVVIAWLLIAAADTPHPVGDYVPIVLGTWLVLALGAWVRMRLSPGLRARVAVIGGRDFAADLTTELAASGVDRFEVVGWIGRSASAEYRRLRWLGELDDVGAAVVAERIDLLVCAPRAEEAEGVRLDSVFERVTDACLDMPVRLISANQLYEEVLGHVPVGTIDAAWYRYIMHPRFNGGSPVSKRLFDLVGAFLIGLFFLPALLAAALAVKLTDRGPVIYRQRRLGEHGREYEILKLRTMRVDAEAEGPRWSMADDDRVTRVGRILRRSHIDELPQLWNVLRGDMTLVGPRPERPEMVAELELRFPHYTRRHLVKPGIAGWAALRCGYAGSDLGTAWKLCHDLFYIKHRSLLGDVLILAETAVEVFRDAHRGLRAPLERFVLGSQHG